MLKAHPGMSKAEKLEGQVHGRNRDAEDADELRFGVHEQMLYARNQRPVQGAQWTGIVTQVACNMLQSGAVDAVVCVQSADDDRCSSSHEITCHDIPEDALDVAHLAE